MRDRLIELLDNIFEGRKTLGDIADYLIDNGVTVQEWISVEDRLPDKGGCYLIHQKAETWIGEVIQTAHWNETEQKFRGANTDPYIVKSTTL